MHTSSSPGCTFRKRRSVPVAGALCLVSSCERDVEVRWGGKEGASGHEGQKKKREAEFPSLGFEKQKHQSSALGWCRMCTFCISQRSRFACRLVRQIESEAASTCYRSVFSCLSLTCVVPSSHSTRSCLAEVKHGGGGKRVRKRARGKAMEKLQREDE